ncbi:hypothetical protein K435DRAFT_112072 [Dendrothele bispora CBS 962.96]|uniref:Uncharacterized protein n=1 Tax=Dendrothele bispora (strain CBS 962.96) TaxID=1314807 RepID=A0A4S8M2K4_DENBC|nr:hypothetical protein K435DRAFT_112072 [Dendrothele bispora CBS 962.96]
MLSDVNSGRCSCSVSLCQSGTVSLGLAMACSGVLIVRVAEYSRLLMATLSIDVAGIFREVRLLVTQLKDDRLVEKEKKKAAQLLVYRTLSLHPALDHMRSPTGALADVDWYTELRSQFVSGIFRKLGAENLSWYTLDSS